MLFVQQYAEVDMINALEATLPAVHAEAFSAEAANGTESTAMELDGKLVVGLQVDLSHNRLSTLALGVNSAGSVVTGKNVHNISPSSGGGSSIYDFSNNGNGNGLSAAAAAAFGSITALDISCNGLTSFDGFDAMPLLAVLAANDNALEETVGLERNKYIHQLDLSGNPIR
jgi:hypothetical protein